MSTIWLVGMMGAGKTAVGRGLAERLGLSFYDTDVEVEKKAGRSIADLWEDEGEAAFRTREEAEVQALAGVDGVVATGGGVVLRAVNVATMRQTGSVIWLHAPVAVLVSRVGRGSARPLLAGDDPAGRLTGIFEDRRTHYEAAAHAVVNTEGKGVDEVVAEVEQWIRS